MRWRRPDPGSIQSLLQSPGLELSYEEVGATTQIERPISESLKRRYDIDHRRFSIGKGERDFEAARQALRTWQHVRVPFVEFLGTEKPVHERQTVASLAKVAGFWFLNPCRVLFVDLDSPNSAAFSYGTLRGHAECGEERFVVRMDPETEEVSYEIAAFSRPAILATRVAYPFARRIQARFAEASARALEAAVTI